MDLALAAFLLIVAGVVTAGVRAASLAFPESDPGRWWRWVLAWMALTGVIATSGVFAPGGLLPPQAFMGLMLAVTVGVSFSAIGVGIARAVPLWALVAFQGFRLPLELVLHEWVAQGVAPPQMTWTGENFDIVAGILALVFAPLVRRHRALAMIPTLVGLGLLLNILRIVATSLPGPAQVFADPVLLPFRFPHVWIGTVCVVGAMTGHLIALIAMRQRGAESA